MNAKINKCFPENMTTGMSSAGQVWGPEDGGLGWGRGRWSFPRRGHRGHFLELGFITKNMGIIQGGHQKALRKQETSLELLLQEEAPGRKRAIGKLHSILTCFKTEETDNPEVSSMKPSILISGVFPRPYQTPSLELYQPYWPTLLSRVQRTLLLNSLL